MVEASLISLVFIMALIGIFEFSTFFRDYTATNESASIAAREASAFGSRTANQGRNGDMAAVESVRLNTGILPISSVRKIVIWRADPKNALVNRPPPACISRSITSDRGIRITATNSEDIVCNVYATRVNVSGGSVQVGGGSETVSVLRAFAEAQRGNSGYFSCPASPSLNLAPCGWPVQQRRDEFGKPVDFIGVYVEVDHKWATTAFSNSTTRIAAYNIRRLEVAQG